MKSGKEITAFLRERDRAEELTGVKHYNTSLALVATTSVNSLVLVQERDDSSNSRGNLIQYPGGWSKKGETPIQTIQREMSDKISRILQGQAQQVFFPNPEDHLFFNEKYGNWFRLDFIEAGISIEDATEIALMTPNGQGHMKLKEGARMKLIPYDSSSLLENWASYDATQAKILTLGRAGIGYRKIGYSQVGFPETKIPEDKKILLTHILE